MARFEKSHCNQLFLVSNVLLVTLKEKKKEILKYFLTSVLRLTMQGSAGAAGEIGDMGRPGAVVSISCYP